MGGGPFHVYQGFLSKQPLRESKQTMNYDVRIMKIMKINYDPIFSKVLQKKSKSARSHEFFKFSQNAE